MNSSNIARWFIYGLILVSVMAILWSSSNNATTAAPVSLTQLAQDIEAGKVKELLVSEASDQVTAVYRADDAQSVQVQISGASSLEETLLAYGISAEVYQSTGTTITYERPSQWASVLGLLTFFLPVVLVLAILFFFMRQNQGANNQAMSFGKSRARLFNSDRPTVTFDDVAGADEAKEELEEIVAFLKEPEKFIGFGARIPKGVLLIGSPGTGKTLMAKAVAGEAGVAFFSIAGSEFVEMFVGVGASRVRDLFEQAKRNSPCIIFIDEIDAVGRQRGTGLGGSHDEREQTLNQILVEMDGFDTDTQIIIIAATNRPDILDPALLRPGRFDRQVVMDKPDIRGREQIFRVHMRGKPVATQVDVHLLAKATPGFAGADIENTVNEAALLSARRNKAAIGMSEFQEAIERVQLGPERRSRVISEEEKELIAYHEAGHAVVSHLLPEAQAMRKVTIIARGMAGGVTWYLEDDNKLYTTRRMKAIIATALGGRVAEELVFGDVTTGAQNDLARITEIARSMVMQFGMGEELGLRVYGKRQEMVFLGREISEQRDYSDAIAEQIDKEVDDIITAQYELVRQLLGENRDKLDLVAQTLLEVETLEADAFAHLLETGILKPTAPTKGGSGDGRSSAKGKKQANPTSPNMDMPPSPTPA